MAFLPYADLDGPETQPLVQRIVAERGSVLHLYQMLLHSPPLAEGWLGYLTAIRQKLVLPGDLREIVIIRIALLNGADYEAEQHAPIALEEGISQTQLDALATWPESGLFNPAQTIALKLTDVITRAASAPQAMVAEAQAVMGERQTVELIATIAAYNMVSRFLEALHIRSTDER